MLKESYDRNRLIYKCCEENMYLRQFSRVREVIMFILLEGFQKGFIMEVTLVSDLEQ